MGLCGLSRLTCVCVFQSDLSTPIRVSLIMVPDTYILIFRNSNCQGAGLIHFQDFNAEVLKCLTIPNVKVNLFKEPPEGTRTSTSVGFFAGDWSEMDKLLLCGDAEQDRTTSGVTEDKTYNGYDIIMMAETVYALSSLPNLYRLIKKVNIQNFHFTEYSFF